jgi:MFS family permease
VRHRPGPPAGQHPALSTGGLFVLTLGALDFGLEQSIILPALPDLADHYGASLVGVAWLGTAFLLTSIVAVPLVSRLGDLFGKRRMLLASLSAFAVGSLICALTRSIEPAIAGRAMQGVGAAVGPLTLGLARDTVAPHRLPRGIGGVVGAANVGGGIGFLLSGLLVDRFSAATVFWFLFVLAVALAIAVAVLVVESPVRSPVRLDVAGSTILGVGLAALLLAISKGPAWGWTSAAIVGLFAAAAVLLTAFALVEHRVPQPLVDMRLVVRKPFAHANLNSFLFGFAFFVAVFVIPQIAAAPEDSGYGFGLSTTEIGFLLAPTSIAGLAGAWAGGRLVDGVGPRLLVATGSLLGIGGYLALAFAHGTPFTLSVESAALGLAWGLILTGIYSVVIRGAGEDETGVAVAVTVVFRNTAVAMGVTVAFVIIAEAGADEAGYTSAFLVAAAGAALGMVAAALLPGRRPTR